MADTVFLVGGGPSLTGFRFDVLRGRAVVAINDALLHLPWASALISVDRRWIANRRDDLEAWPGWKYLAGPEQFPLYKAEWFTCLSERGLGELNGTLHVRGTSGYAALNLVYQWRPRKIYLLGYDHNRGREHWFAPYTWKSVSDCSRYYINWAREYDHTVCQLRKFGVEVINACLDSAITAFPRISLEQMVKELPPL